MVPAALLRVHARLQLGGGRPAGRPGSAATGHVEPLFLEHVERLFDRRVFQEKSGNHIVDRSVRVEHWNHRPLPLTYRTAFPNLFFVRVPLDH